MTSHKTQEDTAVKRMQLIMPLLDESLDHRTIVELKKKIASANNLSYRTISRYLDAYKESSFEGLKPQVGFTRTQSILPANFDTIVDTAVELRRECPTRSVNDLIKIMELEKLIEKDSVSRSTLYNVHIELDTNSEK